MPEFNLRKVVTEVLAATREADPGALADEVLAAIPRSFVRAALAQTLRAYVRQVIAEQRSSTPLKPAAPTTSRKVAAIRDHWQRHLNDRLHVGEDAWKQLRDCTYEDLIYAAEERQAIAERNAALARMYRSYAALLTEHDVQTFGELSAEVQMQALGRAA